MKNSRLVFVALLAVLAASCSRGARVSGVLKDAPEAEVEVRLLDINRYTATAPSTPSRPMPAGHSPMLPKLKKASLSFSIYSTMAVV